MGPLDVRQQIDLSIGDRRETLIVALQIDSGALRMVGLTPFGQKVVELDYDNATVQVHPPLQRLDPVMLAALLQIALWPSDVVRAGLSVPLALDETPGGRRIINGRVEVVTVEFGGVTPRYQRLRLKIPAAHIKLDAVMLDDTDGDNNQAAGEQ
jgi:hypothetical protein